MSKESVELFSRWSKESLGQDLDPRDKWENGSADNFLSWLDTLKLKGNKQTLLILYLSTHQKKDGALKFSKGIDLHGERLIDALNLLAASYKQLLLINDSCYASGLEKCGKFSDNIIRLYSADENEEALDLEFEKGPFGLMEYAEEERRFLMEKWGWKPRGMSFLGLMMLKAGFEKSHGSAQHVDLIALFEKMKNFRDRYDAQIRQAKVQHLILKPDDANIALLKRIK